MRQKGGTAKERGRKWNEDSCHFASTPLHRCPRLHPPTSLTDDAGKETPRLPSPLFAPDGYLDLPALL